MVHVHIHALCRWTRGVPYFVGYATAFVYVHMGGSKGTRPLNVSALTSVLIWTVTLGLLFVAVFGTYNERIPSGVNICMDC